MKPPEHPGETPPGMRWVARLSAAWRVQEGEHCRHSARFRQRECGRPSVAALNRALPGRRDQWWPYCPMHTDGRWVQAGAVWAWTLETVDAHA